MTQATDFPRTDLGETEQFKLASGSVDTDEQGMLGPFSFYGGRRNFIQVADAHPGKETLPDFMCLHCQTWGISDKAAHVCERGLQR